MERPRRKRDEILHNNNNNPNRDSDTVINATIPYNTETKHTRKHPSRLSNLVKVHRRNSFRISKNCNKNSCKTRLHMDSIQCHTHTQTQTHTVVTHRGVRRKVGNGGDDSSIISIVAGSHIRYFCEGKRVRRGVKLFVHRNRKTKKYK